MRIIRNIRTGVRQLQWPINLIGRPVYFPIINDQWHIED